MQQNTVQALIFSVYFFVTSILFKSKQSLNQNNQKEKKKGERDYKKWKMMCHPSQGYGIRIRNTYGIWCMVSGFNHVYCIKSIVRKSIVRKWHFHEVSLHHQESIRIMNPIFYLHPLVDLECTISCSTLLLQEKEVPFELKLIGHHKPICNIILSLF